MKSRPLQIVGFDLLHAGVHILLADSDGKTSNKTGVEGGGIGIATGSGENGSMSNFGLRSSLSHGS